MKAVVLEIDERLVEERRRLGLDGHDEMWEGVLHMVPPAGGPHQGMGTRLIVVLVPLADRLGLVARYETGVFRPGVDDDYRIPDLVVTRPSRLSSRGIEGGPEMVVEILSPGDETSLKLPWYFELGVEEMLIVDPLTKAVEQHRASAEGPVQVAPDADGVVWSDVLQCGFATAGDALRVTWEDGQADVRPD